MHLPMKTPFPYFLLVLVALGCGVENPNVDRSTGRDEFKILELDHPLDRNALRYQETFYVPIYSDIYIDLQNQNSLLAATLSIRNTSFRDSLFIDRIDYFETTGELVRAFIRAPIALPPMGTVNYVVDRDDDTGGPGANFIVEIAARNAAVKPLLEAVMIGQHGNKSFAFTSQGFTVTERVLPEPQPLAPGAAGSSDLPTPEMPREQDEDGEYFEPSE